MKISIIVPIYNTEKYLEKCIDSILNQTFKDFELILVDDGSTDSSGDICDMYAQRDDRIVVVHKDNGGQATARNIGLDIAKGEYISFIDSDDYIEPQMYQEMLTAIDNTSAEIAMCGRMLVSADYDKKISYFDLQKQEIWEKDEIKRRFLLTENIDGSPCDKIFQKALFEKPTKVRFPQGYICEDLPTVFELLFKSDRLVHVGTPYYNYYQRKNSTSRTREIQEKTYGVIKYPKEIQKKVCEKYPQFSMEAGCFYARQLLIFLFYLDPKYNRNQCKKYRKELLSYKKAFLKYAPKQQKRLFNLFRFNLFYFLRKIKRIFKR